MKSCGPGVLLVLVFVSRFPFPVCPSFFSAPPSLICLHLSDSALPLSTFPVLLTTFPFHQHARLFISQFLHLCRVWSVCPPTPAVLVSLLSSTKHFPLHPPFLPPREQTSSLPLTRAFISFAGSPQLLTSSPYLHPSLYSSRFRSLRPLFRSHPPSLPAFFLFF